MRLADELHAWLTLVISAASALDPLGGAVRSYRRAVPLFVLLVATVCATAAFGEQSTRAHRASTETPVFFDSHTDLAEAIGSNAGFGRRPVALTVYPHDEWELFQLHWKTWSATAATATGSSWVNNCEPNCLADNISRDPAHLTLSDPGAFDGHLVFRCWRIVAANSPQKGRTLCLTRSSGSWWFEPSHR
jgi:hypothetical protein